MKRYICYGYDDFIALFKTLEDAEKYRENRRDCIGEVLGIRERDFSEIEILRIENFDNGRPYKSTPFFSALYEGDFIKAFSQKK